MMDSRLLLNPEFSIGTVWKSANGKSTFHGTLKRNHLAEIELIIGGPQQIDLTTAITDYYGQNDEDDIRIELIDLPTVFNRQPLRVNRGLINQGPMTEAKAVKGLYVPITGLYEWLSKLASPESEPHGLVLSRARNKDFRVEIGWRAEKGSTSFPRGYLKLETIPGANRVSASTLLKCSQNLLAYLSYLSGSAFELLIANITWLPEYFDKTTYFFGSSARHRYRRTDLNPERLDFESAKRMQKIIQNTLPNFLNGHGVSTHPHISYFIEATNTRSNSPLENLHKFHILISSFEGLLHARAVALDAIENDARKSLKPLMHMAHNRYSKDFSSLVANKLLHDIGTRGRKARIMSAFRTRLVEHRNALLHGKYLNNWTELDLKEISDKYLPVVSALHYYELLMHLGSGEEDLMKELVKVKDRVYWLRSSSTHVIRAAAEAPDIQLIAPNAVFSDRH